MCSDSCAFRRLAVHGVCGAQVSARYFGPGCDKKNFQKLAMRWHPDKFLQRYGNRLAAEDKERILVKVKEVFQAINALRK